MWKPGDPLPDWLREHRLPRGGPDRVRFCMAYGDYVAEGKTDAEARESARGCIQLLYFYIAGMGLEEAKRTMGPSSLGLPLEYMGEDGSP